MASKKGFPPEVEISYVSRSRNLGTWLHTSDRKGERKSRARSWHMKYYPVSRLVGLLTGSLDCTSGQIILKQVDRQQRWTLRFGLIGLDLFHKNLPLSGSFCHCIVPCVRVINRVARSALTFAVTKRPTYIWRYFRPIISG